MENHFVGIDYVLEHIEFSVCRRLSSESNESREKEEDLASLSREKEDEQVPQLIIYEDTLV